MSDRGLDVDAHRRKAGGASEEAGRSTTRAPLSERAYGGLFLLLVAVVLLLSDRGQIAGDGAVRWEALRTVMSEHRLPTSKYSLVQPLLASPLYLAGDIWARAAGLDAAGRERAIRSIAKRFNKVVAFGTALWLFLVLRRVGRWSAREASLATCFLLFGSMLILDAKDFYGECLWTLLSLVALSCLVSLAGKDWRDAGVGRPLAAVGAVALALPADPLLLVVLAPLGVFLAARRAVRSGPSRIAERLVAAVAPEVLALGLGLVAGSGLCLGENLLRRGAAWDFGYPGEGFTTPFLHGLSAELIAPARGILLFAPALLPCLVMVWLRRRLLPVALRDLVAITALYSALLLASYATWHGWHGGWYWGPRFLLPLSIFGCLYFALAARLWWRDGRRWTRGLLTTLGALSFVVYKTGVGVGQRHLVDCLELHPTGESCYWQLRHLPYASWLDPGDLLLMLTSRSTLVEAAAALLMLLLLRRAPATPHPSRRREPP